MWGCEEAGGRCGRVYRMSVGKCVGVCVWGGGKVWGCKEGKEKREGEEVWGAGVRECMR